MKTQALVNAVGAVGGVVLAYMGVGYIMGKIPVSPPALNPRSGGPTNAPVEIQGPRLMTGTPLLVKPRNRYGVALNTPKVFGSSLVSDTAIRSKAASMGFVNVLVSDQPPEGWPGTTFKNADRYVVGFYQGQNIQSLPRNESGLDVLEAWEG